MVLEKLCSIYVYVDNVKEVRHTLGRFMALSLSKSEWHDAKGPSPLTKEIREKS